MQEKTSLTESKSVIFKLDYKLGDLVRDLDPEYKGEYGIIIDLDPHEGMYKVLFPDGSEWLTKMFLELVSESR